jgi:hypothetical protein
MRACNEDSGERKQRHAVGKGVRDSAGLWVSHLKVSFDLEHDLVRPSEIARSQHTLSTLSNVSGPLESWEGLYIYNRKHPRFQ